MALADELLDSISEEQFAEYMLVEENPHIVIDEDRNIILPERYKIIAAQGDHDMTTYTFDCPRFSDGRDMSKMVVYINYIRSDGETGSYPADNVSIDAQDNDLMHFEWTPLLPATLEHGAFAFLVCVCRAEPDGSIKNHWSTRLCKDATISEGMDCHKDTIINMYPDVITRILERLNVLEDGGTTSVQYTVQDLEEEQKVQARKNIEAADAKEVSKLSEDKASNPSTGKVGQILEIESVDENGKPKTYKAVNKPTGGEVSDEQIVEAVENYLTKNPIEGGGADGEDGVGILSVKQTTTSIEDNGINIITVTKTDGTSSSFEVRNGSKGSQGIQGEKGEQGIQGEKGEKGDTGETGSKGDKGDTGERGADGKTAYQYAQDGGYTGTKEEFASKMAQESPTKEEFDKLSEENVNLTGRVETLEKGGSKKFCSMGIIGDSYSAYKDWIPSDYQPSYGQNNYNNITSVKQMWWWILADSIGTTILRNSSYSGSTICNTGNDGADATETSFLTRAKNDFGLSKILEPKPDLLFVFGGTNDDWANVEIGEAKYLDWTVDDLKKVAPAFCKLLSNLKEYNVGSKIVFILNTELSNDISTKLKEICSYYSVLCVELTDIEKENSHPSINGMVQIANQIQNALGTFGDNTGGEDEPDVPDNPDEPEKTLSSISATYTGGEVTVGTALTDLTGITVKAHYSDGSTANVTGYTLSGEIVEGKNIITISYGGKTTTFTVTGIVDSGLTVISTKTFNWSVGTDKDVAYETHEVSYQTGDTIRVEYNVLTEGGDAGLFYIGVDYQNGILKLERNTSGEFVLTEDVTFIGTYVAKASTTACEVEVIVTQLR